MDDKIKIPHEYLSALRRMREGSIIPSDLAKVDEFIAAAEADQPPLPKGWVLLRYSDGSHGVLYYPGRGDVLTRYDNGTGNNISVEAVRDYLTPLRPTVTEADVEKAARAARAAFLNGADDWDAVHQAARDGWMKVARATLAALGIEIDKKIKEQH